MKYVAGFFVGMMLLVLWLAAICIVVLAFIHPEYTVPIFLIAVFGYAGMVIVGAVEWPEIG